MTTADLLRKSEEELRYHLQKQTLQPGAAVVGPAGSILNLGVQIQMPFKELLAGNQALGIPRVPDEVLYLMLKELETEIRSRGLKT